jgi:hypothetical protein
MVRVFCGGSFKKKRKKTGTSKQKAEAPKRRRRRRRRPARPVRKWNFNKKLESI